MRDETQNLEEHYALVKRAGELYSNPERYIEDMYREELTDTEIYGLIDAEEEALDEIQGLT